MNFFRKYFNAISLLMLFNLSPLKKNLFYDARRERSKSVTDITGLKEFRGMGVESMTQLVSVDVLLHIKLKR